MGAEYANTQVDIKEKRRESKRKKEKKECTKNYTKNLEEYSCGIIGDIIQLFNQSVQTEIA